MRFHNLRHIALKKVGKIDEFPPFCFWFKKNIPLLAENSWFHPKML